MQTMQEVMDKLAELNQELESMARKAWEREFRLLPEASRDELCSRIYVQVGKLLHRLQERADQHTWNRDDKYMMDGLANIVVLHFRLDKLTEGATKGPKL